MNVTFSCPRCSQPARRDIDSGTAEIACPHCQQAIQIPSGAFEGETLTRCLVCPSTDLFVRKDFPQRVGVGLVAAGIVGSSVAWALSLPVWTFGILLATALADVVLYLIVPDALMCYRCSAQYRSFPGQERHGGFSLETHERHRQQVARMAGQRR